MKAQLDAQLALSTTLSNNLSVMLKQAVVLRQMLETALIVKDVWASNADPAARLAPSAAPDARGGCASGSAESFQRDSNKRSRPDSEQHDHSEIMNGNLGTPAKRQHRQAPGVDPATAARLASTPLAPQPPAYAQAPPPAPAPAPHPPAALPAQEHQHQQVEAWAAQQARQTRWDVARWEAPAAAPGERRLGRQAGVPALLLHTPQHVKPGEEHHSQCSWPSQSPTAGLLPQLCSSLSHVESVDTQPLHPASPASPRTQPAAMPPLRMPASGHSHGPYQVLSGPATQPAVGGHEQLPCPLSSNSIAAWQPWAGPAAGSEASRVGVSACGGGGCGGRSGNLMRPGPADVSPASAPTGVALPGAPPVISRGGAQPQAAAGPPGPAQVQHATLGGGQLCGHPAGGGNSAPAPPPAAGTPGPEGAFSRSSDPWVPRAALAAAATRAAADEAAADEAALPSLAELLSLPEAQPGRRRRRGLGTHGSQPSAPAAVAAAPGFGAIRHQAIAPCAPGGGSSATAPPYATPRLTPEPPVYRILDLSAGAPGLLLAGAAPPPPSPPASAAAPAPRRLFDWTPQPCQPPAAHTPQLTVALGSRAGSGGGWDAAAAPAAGAAFPAFGVAPLQPLQPLPAVPPLPSALVAAANAIAARRAANGGAAPSSEDWPAVRTCGL